MSSHGGESGRWMVSYADFLTLLFVLFVVLYAMGQTDVQRYKEIAESFRAAFSLGAGGPARVVSPMIDSSGGVTDENAPPAPIVVEGLQRQSSSGAEIARDLVRMLSESNLSSDVSVQNNIEGVLIALSEKLLFLEGTVQLVPEAYPVLDDVVGMLRAMDNDIRVVGYTDNTPPKDARYTDNWQLSLARASVVVDYLISKGIDPRRLTVSGRGEYFPILPNDTPEHRALNNRVDIVVVYPKETEDVIQLNLSSVP